MRLTAIACFVAGLLTSSGAGDCAAADASPETYLKEAAGNVTALMVHPPAVEIDRPLAYAQVLVTAVLADGGRVDVTRLAQRKLSGDVVTIDEAGLVRPVKDGAGTIELTFGGQSANVPVRVTNRNAAPQASFVQDVLPAMSRMGCNAGTCHGSKDGKNGFKLSLRGYDPLYDHRALTDDIAGRRFNRAAPEKSLMLLKTSGSVPHVGGALTSPGEPYYELLRTWIAGGVQLDLDAPRVRSIEMIPASVTVPLPQMEQQFKVIATYGDGSQRDVTAEAFVEPSDIEVLAAENRGVVRALRRGQAAVLARYEGQYAAAPVVVMGDRSGFAWEQRPVYNAIDELVDAQLKRLKIQPSDLCDDAAFIRRVYIDLTGLPPTSDEVRAFLADERDSRAKREELIDRLIGSDAFIEHWANKWADMLQVSRKYLTPAQTKAFRDWIRARVAENMPYDKLAYTILTASGSALKNPPAAYYQTLRTPGEMTENTTHLFLATRFNCNKCHDHPFERWTQDQYYELAAFFARVEHKQAPGAKAIKQGGNAPKTDRKFDVEMIVDAAQGEVKHDRTGAVAPPQFPYAHAAMPDDKASRREQLARWITAAENPYFARSYVNRVWAYLLGVGLIEPIDDIRAGNPPTNPELLDHLTEKFIADGFDVRKLMAYICRSRTYQLSIATNPFNENDHVNYSRRYPQRLSAEVLYDAVHRVTGSQSRLPGLPAGARAAELPDTSGSLPDDFLSLFGRPARESACECERSEDMLLGPIMNLVNGPTINSAIADPNSAIARLVREQPDDAAVVRELFLRILNRPPTEQEIAECVPSLQLSTFDADHAVLVAKLSAYEQELDARQSKWEERYRKIAAPTWTAVEFVSGESKAGATFEKQDDQSVKVGGTLAKDTHTLKFKSAVVGITGIRVEALPDDSLPAKGPGRAQNGNFVLSEFKVAAESAADANQKQNVELENASADFSQANWAVAGAIDGNAGTGWAVSPEFGKPHTAVFQTKQDAGFEGGALLNITMQYDFPDGKHQLGRFRIAVTTSPRPVRTGGSGLPDVIEKLIQTDAGQRTPQQAQQLRDYHRGLDAQLKELQADVASHARLGDDRLIGAQDIAWALINSPAFLFNR